MKTGKKVLGAVLAAAMALSSITPVFAADKVKITFMIHLWQRFMKTRLQHLWKKILILKFRTILFMRNLLITIN